MEDEFEDDGNWSEDRPEPQTRALEPKPYKMRKVKKRVCTFDTETDPFEEGLVVEPFTCGFYDGEGYYDFWGPDCIAQFFKFLEENYADEELLILCHNFGRFDAFFQRDYLDLDQEPFIMGGAIVSAMYQGHEFRDSYRIIPVPLSSYKKDDIDYNKMKRDVRHKHKAEILHYQKGDCVYLYELVSAFYERFGDKLTIGSTALPMLNSFHAFRLMKEEMDALIRPYYYGGRTQCFEVGVFEGKFIIYDVNSMYPHVMRSMLHPIGSTYTVDRYVSEKTAFILVEGWSGGAFPTRKEDNGLDFPRGHNKFWISRHEYDAALETGSFSLDRIIHVRNCEEWSKFDGFIDHYYEDRLKAKANDDAVTDLFDKLLMNSSYGKFAQNPAKYESFELRHIEDPFDLEDMRQPCVDETCAYFGHKNSKCPTRRWYCHTTNDETVIWARKSKHAWRSYKNVGIAASITGGARAELLRGIHRATRPMYCDTDSLICEGFDGPVDSKTLGAWKLEAEGDVVALAGKKMYVVLSYDLTPDKKGVTEYATYNGRKMKVVKKASKGVRLTADEILRVAMGETILYKNPVPKFGLDGSATFVNRHVKRTA